MSGSTETLLTLRVAASILGCSVRRSGAESPRGRCQRSRSNPPGWKRYRWRIPESELVHVLPSAHDSSRTLEGTPMRMSRQLGVGRRRSARPPALLEYPSSGSHVGARASPLRRGR